MDLIKTKDLVKSYNGRRVVNKINIEIHRGEVVGLLGPNGAGKTTTFYMIIGLINPDKGEVFFGNRNITGFPMYKRARFGIGYLSQETSTFRKLTVKENIMAILETLRIPPKAREGRCDALLDELNIKHLTKNKAYTLSGGERRRLEITRALVSNPAFLLLDEPFSGVDPIAVFEVQQIINQLKNRGLGILLTDHSVRETLAITDRSYIMADGEILISGTSSELVNDSKARQIYLGEKFTL